MAEAFFTQFAIIILFITASIVCIGIIIAAIAAIALIVKLWKEVFRKDE